MRRTRNPGVETTRVHHDKNVTVITAWTFSGGELVAANGIARRHPEDHYDAQTAELLAYGRAYENLGRALMRRANGRVKMLDNQRDGLVNSSRQRKVEADIEDAIKKAFNATPKEVTAKPVTKAARKTVKATKKAVRKRGVIPQP